MAVRVAVLLLERGMAEHLLGISSEDGRRVAIRLMPDSPASARSQDAGTDGPSDV